MEPVKTLFASCEDKMKSVVGGITREFTEIRGGRATPALVEHITAEYYGAQTPIKQLAAITAPEPRMLMIQPWDANALVGIEKAIQKASLGITPAVDGKVIRLPIPPLSGERRQELTRLVHKIAEETRVHIRNVRRDTNDGIKKLKTDKKISEDEFFSAQEKIQNLTNQFIKQIDSLVSNKEQELQSV